MILSAIATVFLIIGICGAVVAGFLTFACIVNLIVKPEDD